MKFLKALPIMAALLFGATTTSQAQVAESAMVFFAVGDVIADAGPDQGPFTLPAGGSVNVTMYGLDSQALVPGATIVSYVWNDGTTSKTGPTPTYTYSVAGIYTIALVVTDSLGNSATASMMVTISPGVSTPLTITPAANKTVECDGQGNLVAFTMWLQTHGGSIASGGAPPVTWTDNFNENTSWVVGTGQIDEYATVTFKATDATGTIKTTTATFYIKDTTAPPLNWFINGTAVADYTIQTVPCNTNCVTIKVVPADLCGGSTLAKSYCWLQGCGSVSYSTSAGGTTNDTVTVTGLNSNEKIRVYFKATDDSGNSSAYEWVEIDVANNCYNYIGCGGSGGGSGCNSYHPNTTCKKHKRR
jgi:PKD repeat protein